MAANFYARRVLGYAHNEVMHTPERARRYSFVATIELTDLQSEAKSQERTSDLSLFGCRVDTHKPFLTKVRIRIAHRSANFVALGRISYTTSDGGLGIAFTQIEPTNQLILEKWVEELRDHLRTPDHRLCLLRPGNSGATGSHSLRAEPELVHDLIFRVG